MPLQPGQIVKNLVPSEPVVINSIQNLGSKVSIKFTGVNTNLANNKVVTQAELDELAKRIEAQRALVATAPSEENSKELNDLLKQQSRASDKNRRALDDERNMKKKGDDLVWDIRKNEEDQVKITEEITRQEQLVTALREKLANIK